MFAWPRAQLHVGEKARETFVPGMSALFVSFSRSVIANAAAVPLAKAAGRIALGEANRARAALFSVNARAAWVIVELAFRSLSSAPPTRAS